MAHGGKRAGAGRKTGAVTKAKRDLADLAKDQAEAALQVLVDIALKGESEAARVSAANAILDRGYGKASQSIEHSGKGGKPIEQRIEHKIDEATISSAMEKLKSLG